LNSLHDFDGVQIGNLIFLIEISHPATKDLPHILAGGSSANGARALLVSVAVVESLGSIVIIYRVRPFYGQRTSMNADTHQLLLIQLQFLAFLPAYMGIPRVQFEVLEVGMWPRRRRRCNVTSRHLYSGSTAGTARELKGNEYWLDREIDGHTAFRHSISSARLSHRRLR
jgi:hypothetical protein